MLCSMDTNTKKASHRLAFLMEEPNGLDAHNGCTVFCRYAIFDCSIFLLSQNRYVLASLKLDMI